MVKEKRYIFSFQYKKYQNKDRYFFYCHINIFFSKKEQKTQIQTNTIPTTTKYDGFFLPLLKNNL